MNFHSDYDQKQVYCYQNHRPSAFFSFTANCCVTVASNVPHIPAPEDIYMKHSQNDNWQGKPEVF